MFIYEKNHARRNLTIRGPALPVRHKRFTVVLNYVINTVVYNQACTGFNISKINYSPGPEGYTTICELLQYGRRWVTGVMKAFPAENSTRWKCRNRKYRTGWKEGKKSRTVETNGICKYSQRLERRYSVNRCFSSKWIILLRRLGRYIGLPHCCFLYALLKFNRLANFRSEFCQTRFRY